MAPSSERVWISAATTSVEPVVNPLIAACESGYVPNQVKILINEGVSEQAEEAIALVQEILSVYDVSEPAVERVTLENERDFDRIVQYYQSAIESAETAAVDVTPGRKFVSALAFQAGAEYGADHVYYLYVESQRYYGQLYPSIPEPATDLVDFREVVR